MEFRIKVLKKDDLVLGEFALALGKCIGGNGNIAMLPGILQVKESPFKEWEDVKFKEMKQ